MSRRGKIDLYAGAGADGQGDKPPDFDDELILRANLDEDSKCRMNARPESFGQDQSQPQRT